MSKPIKPPATDPDHRVAYQFPVVPDPIQDTSVVSAASWEWTHWAVTVAVLVGPWVVTLLYALFCTFVSLEPAADDDGIDTAGAGAAVATGTFVPSTAFEGAKEGFVFKKGQSGLGYYADSVGSPQNRNNGNEETRTLFGLYLLLKHVQPDKNGGMGRQALESAFRELHTACGEDAEDAWRAAQAYCEGGARDRVAVVIAGSCAVSRFERHGGGSGDADVPVWVSSAFVRMGTAHLELHYDSLVGALEMFDPADESSETSTPPELWPPADFIAALDTVRDRGQLRACLQEGLRTNTCSAPFFHLMMADIMASYIQHNSWATRGRCGSFASASASASASLSHGHRRQDLGANAHTSLADCTREICLL